MKNKYLLILPFLGVIIISLMYILKLNSQPICLTSEPGDSELFGNSLAINDKYLAVGDPEANRVVLYTRNEKGKWVRTREIKPPSGSRTERVGSGLGSDLALDGATLVIGAYTQKHKPNNLEAFQSTNPLGISFSGGVYKVLLDQVNAKVVLHFLVC